MTCFCFFFFFFQFYLIHIHLFIPFLLICGEYNRRTLTMILFCLLIFHWHHCVMSSIFSLVPHNAMPHFFKFLEAIEVCHSRNTDLAQQSTTLWLLVGLAKWEHMTPWFSGVMALLTKVLNGLVRSRAKYTRTRDIVFLACDSSVMQSDHHAGSSPTQARKTVSLVCVYGTLAHSVSQSCECQK